MDIIMDIKGYLLLICKDIFFHSRYSCVYPFVSFIISSIFFIDIQLLSVYILRFILSNPFISCSFILIFILIYPHLIQHFYPFVSCYLSLLYPDIYPAGYSILFSADPARRGVLLNRTLFCISCSATG